MKKLLLKKLSNIDGVGIFADKAIYVNTIFYKVPTNLISKIPKPKFARIGDQQYADDPQVLNYINHSCDPNCELNIASQQPVLIALRDIEIGEEITCDYNRTEINGTGFECNCGSPKCRGYFLSEK